jgi:hypothetical protein
MRAGTPHYSPIIRLQRRVPSERWIQQVRADYRQMRWLNVSVDEGMRLWQMDRAECAAVLHHLVQEGFLQTYGGKYRLVRPS